MPLLMPVSTPVVEIVPTAPLTLLHVPPVLASVSAVVSPLHTARVPVIIAGCRSTVTMVVAAQSPMAYEITEVPTVPPVTTPAVEIAATPPLTLLHTPPLVASDKVMEKVWHTGVLPVIGVGCVFTVTVCVTLHVPIA